VRPLPLALLMLAACTAGGGKDVAPDDTDTTPDTDPVETDTRPDTDPPVDDTDLPVDDTDPVETDPPADDTDTRPVETDPPADDTDTRPVETAPPAEDTDTLPIETDTPPDRAPHLRPRRGAARPLLAVFGDQLAVVDVVTGAATPLGVTLSAADLIEVAVDPRDGAWYGLRRGGAAPVLARLDLCTGVVTDVGTLLVAGRAVSSAEGFTIRGDGSAVVSVSLNGADFPAETLADLNLATGALSNTRTIQSFQDDVDEMFTDGAVWGSDSYVCGAGWCTEVGRVDNAGALQVIDTLDLHVTTFAFNGQASVIYAYNHDFGPGLESLYRIDPATAAATPVGPIDPAGAFAAGPARVRVTAPAPLHRPPGSPATLAKPA
jgi:hypothetical protein